MSDSFFLLLPLFLWFLVFFSLFFILRFLLHFIKKPFSSHFHIYAAFHIIVLIPFPPTFILFHRILILSTYLLSQLLFFLALPRGRSSSPFSIFFLHLLLSSRLSFLYLSSSPLLHLLPPRPPSPFFSTLPLRSSSSSAFFLAPFSTSFLVYPPSPYDTRLSLRGMENLLAFACLPALLWGDVTLCSIGELIKSQEDTVKNRIELRLFRLRKSGDDDDYDE